MAISAAASHNRLRERQGFVLPLAIFAIVLMVTVAVNMIVTSQDEYLAARAMREATLAFYAAEAGLNEIRASVPDTVFSDLPPRGSRSLGWRTLPGGSRYQATIQRWDTSGIQNVYTVRVEGQSPGGARKTLDVALTGLPPRRFRLGQCCDAALTIRGAVDMDGQAIVNGNDVVPPGWEDNCQTPTENRPGIIMQDTTLLTNDNGKITGDPPVAQDSELNDASFDEFGPITWDTIRGLATHVIDAVPEKKLDGVNGPRIQPSYNHDGTCNTDDPYNWGSPVPGDPCFGYFPIVLIRGEVEVHNGYGQAVVIVDWDDSRPPGEKGGEFELETDFVFNGLILGKGCIEIQKGATFHGAVFVDSNYRHEDLCGADLDFDMNEQRPTVQWSQCAVDRAIVGSGLDRYAESDATPPKALPSRSFGEVFF